MLYVTCSMKSVAFLLGFHSLLTNNLGFNNKYNELRSAILVIRKHLAMTFFGFYVLDIIFLIIV